jgi:hypothetical protein
MTKKSTSHAETSTSVHRRASPKRSASRHFLLAGSYHASTIKLVPERILYSRILRPFQKTLVSGWNIPLREYSVANPL